MCHIYDQLKELQAENTKHKNHICIMVDWTNQTTRQ